MPLPSAVSRSRMCSRTNGALKSHAWRRSWPVPQHQVLVSMAIKCDWGVTFSMARWGLLRTLWDLAPMSSSSSPMLPRAAQNGPAESCSSAGGAITLCTPRLMWLARRNSWEQSGSGGLKHTQSVAEWVGGCWSKAREPWWGLVRPNNVTICSPEAHVGIVSPLLLQRQTICSWARELMIFFVTSAMEIEWNTFTIAHQKSKKWMIVYVFVAFLMSSIPQLYESLELRCFPVLRKSSDEKK